MKLKLEKNIDSLSYDIVLERNIVAQVIVSLTSAKENTFETYFVVKEYNTQHKDLEEIKFYKESFSTIMDTLRGLEVSLRDKTFIEVAEEEIDKTIHSSDL